MPDRKEEMNGSKIDGVYDSEGHRDRCARTGRLVIDQLVRMLGLDDQDLSPRDVQEIVRQAVNSADKIEHLNNVRKIK